MSNFDDLLEYLKQKELEGDKFAREQLDTWEIIKNIQNGIYKNQR